VSNEGTSLLEYAHN